MKQHFLVLPLTSWRYKSAKKAVVHESMIARVELKKTVEKPLLMVVMKKWLLCEIFENWKWYVFEIRRSQELSRILLPFRWTCIHFIEQTICSFFCFTTVESFVTATCLQRSPSDRPLFRPSRSCVHCCFNVSIIATSLQRPPAP